MSPLLTEEHNDDLVNDAFYIYIPHVVPEGVGLIKSRTATLSPYLLASYQKQDTMVKPTTKYNLEDDLDGWLFGGGGGDYF